jgi:hypothetical protein
MLKSMSVHLMRARHKLKLCINTISTEGMELSKTMRGIRRGMQERSEGKGFWFKTRKDVKGVGRDDIREVRDYSDGVPGIGGLKEGCVIGGQRRREKSRSSVRM